MRRLLPLLLLALLSAAGAAGCRGPQLPRSGEVPRAVSVDEVPHAIERAEQELAAGRPAIALEWMVRANELPTLEGPTRSRVQTLLDRAAEARIDELERTGAHPRELEILTKIGLPRHVAVTAGMAAARGFQARGDHDDVFRVIRELDAAFPMHHERAQAGSMLIDSGLALSHSERRFLFFWRARDDGRAMLHYVTIEYPSEPRGDLAYARLAEMYEQDESYEQAVLAHEELILNYPGSSLRPYSEARIPHLRLRRIASPEYDRATLLRARRELAEWLRRYPEHVLRPVVVEDLDDALRRLSESDLIIARFYRRVGNSFGLRFHAQRALELASEARDEDRARRAEELLAALPREDQEVPVAGDVETGGLQDFEP